MKACIIAIALCALPGFAQTKTLACDSSDRNGPQTRHCEMREQSLGFAGRLTVDAGVNGGVSIKAWDQGGVLVRARVDASAADAATAASIASQVRLDLSAGQVSASGPTSTGDQNWSVSYEVFVPRSGDLNIKTHNGGISIADVRGTIQFAAMNGGVTLARLAGDVSGTTKNGALTIELAGDHWDGAKLDARTTNGGINVTVPQRYSAHLETATVNGRLNLNVPMTLHGEISRHATADLGSGGATLHLETTNGGVNIKSAS